MNSERTGIDKWFEEGRQAALNGEGVGRECPYGDHWTDEYLWWWRGYRYVDRSVRLLEAEKLIEEMKGDRT